MIPLRIALVGGTFGPDLPVIMTMLGKDEIKRRIIRCLEFISKRQAGI